MKQYELMVIVDPDIGTDAINAKLEEVKKLIASQEGEVFFEDLWGIRDLAYKIKKSDRGFYAVYDFNMESAGLKEINTILKLDNGVLRHLLVALPVDYAPKSLAEIQKEAEDAAAVRTAQKEEAKTPKVATPPVKEVKKEAAPVEETKVKEPEKEEKKAPKSTLEDVDKKLSNLLDNPDLNF